MREYFCILGVENVELTFKCDNCGENIETNRIKLPSQSFKKEYNHKSICAVCPGCQKQFKISIFVQFIDGYVEIKFYGGNSIYIKGYDNLGDFTNTELFDFYELETKAILDGSKYINATVEEINELCFLHDFNTLPEEQQHLIRKMIFPGLIACLEDYLFTTLKQLILNNEECFKKFVKNYPKFQNDKIQLCNIFEKVDSLSFLVTKELSEIIYHNLPKVKNIYEKSTWIEFPKIDDLKEAIKIRHNIVHRNGRTKEGEKNIITRKAVNDLIKSIRLFVDEMEEKLANIK
ncbi:MAG: hypothetical protein GY749_23100 [Desulfobacteraceae bacterium]|nr:hypothetical protein [Desulfobacteraceae bacterium]